MSDPLLAATIAASAALIVSFINSILADAFRRHQDRKIMAASIAGELASYAPALPNVMRMLHEIITAIERRSRSSIIIRPYDQPKDYVFEKIVERLGLLGPKLAEDVVFTYSNLNTFRVSFGLIVMHFNEMPDAEAHARCLACLEVLNTTYQRGISLIASLKKIAGT